MSRYGFAFTPLQKAILGAALLLCVWRYMQIPSVVDAILNFCFAGEIPGTDQTLSPDATLLFVAAASTIGGLVIGFRLFLAGRGKGAGAAPRFASPAGVASAPISPIVVIPPIASAAPRRRPNQLLLRIRRLGHYAVTFAQRMASRARVQAHRLATAARPRLQQAWAVTRRLSVQAALFVMAFCVAAWRWLEPYARRFDAWLKVTLNQYRPTAVAVDIARQATRFWAEVRKLTRDLGARR
jgi:hypothetical protein